MSDTAIGTRPPTPFKELDFFVEADAWMFAGREREARQLVSRIVNSRAIVVHGRSGLGKTSLLRAGVIPLLRQQNFRPVYVRTLDSLLGDLVEAVVQDCQLPPPPMGTDGDPEASARHVIEVAAAVGPLVLVLDQFEEFFTRFERQPRNRQAFVQFIADIVRDAKRDVRVVFSLREDYLYALDEFQRKLPDLFAQAFRLLPLTPLGAREAIIRPLVNEKVPYDEALITQLVDELTGFDFDSARLQVTCSEVYRHALAGTNGSVVLKAGDLDSLKESAGTGLRGIYKRYLRAAVDNIPPVLHLETKLLLDKLISAKHTKFAIGREALHAEFADAPRVDLVLTALVEQKLVRSETRGGKVWFELRHECLVEEILEWFKEDTTFDSFRFVRGLIEENSRDGRFRTRPERLLTADQLAALLPLRERLRLAREQLEYVLQSAVYTHSPEILTWAKYQPTSDTDPLLRTLLQSSLPQMRLGAIIAIGIVASKASDLTASCLKLAFDEKAPKDLRTAAQKSAASVVSESDLTTLEPWARFGRTPPEMREFMANLYEAGRIRKSFNVLQQWLTVRHIARRRSQRYADQRPSFISGGILGGVCGGLGCVLPAAIVLMLASSPPSRPSDLLIAVTAAIGGAVIIGAVIGWRDGAAAYRVCVMGMTRWRGAAAPSLLIQSTLKVWFFKGFLLLVLLISLFSAGEQSFFIGGLMLVGLGGLALVGLALVWLVLRLMLAAMVAATESVIRRRSTQRARILCSSMISLVSAIVLAIAGSFAILFDNEATMHIVLILLGLLCLLNIDLCSFSLAFPPTGIEGAQPLELPQKVSRSQK